MHRGVVVHSFFLTRIAVAVVAAMTLAGPAMADTPDPVREKAAAIIGRFDAALRACGVEPEFVPGIVIDSDPTIISFYDRTRSVHLSRWSEMPPPVQGLMEAWAEGGTLGLAPEAHFAEIFNSLLIPHELGHYVAMMDGRFRTQDFWTNEVQANRIALAFWAMDAEPGRPLADRVENFTRFLSALPDPVPAGQDPRAYFEANYEALGADPMAYGWYQGAFMRAAWAEHESAGFCDLVKPSGA